ncbi:hypothetical protein LUZ60_014844 [Juncus effusus]|nr:hypothetical protein LUZ60_014844 [Juncus effusus]
MSTCIKFFSNCYDAICLMLMICITSKHQVKMRSREIPCLDSYLDKVFINLWPRFKTVLDMHLQTLLKCDIKTIWENDVHPHYIIRCYAEFIASLFQLNILYGDNQEELLRDHFGKLINYVKDYISEDLISYKILPTNPSIEPILKDFSVNWKNILEQMHREVITSCSNLLCGMEILKAAMAQLLNYYNQLSECVKFIPGGSVLNKHLVSITSVSYEIRKYSRTL